MASRPLESELLARAPAGRADVQDPVRPGFAQAEERREELLLDGAPARAVEHDRVDVLQPVEPLLATAVEERRVGERAGQELAAARELLQRGGEQPRLAAGVP